MHTFHSFPVDTFIHCMAKSMESHTMIEKYNPQKVEATAQAAWAEEKTFLTDEKPSKKTYYCLAMLPYPSGELHMGHVRNYLISDIVARYRKMKGYAVLHPIGWDAFGLPAENAAIECKKSPESWTQFNISVMRTQFKQLGFSFDWTREINTSDPSYFRWEQWLFLKLYEKGLAYQKEQWVNWCPKDETVLANEQVVQGSCWRCGSLVQKRSLRQWFLRMSAYAPALLSALDELKDWPAQVIKMQKHWIGRQVGLQIEFACYPESSDQIAPIQSLSIFTTRPETLFGVSYLAVGTQHPLTQWYLQQFSSDRELVTSVQEIERFSIEKAQGREEIKTVKGLRLPFFATHPKTGQALPIWVVDYVVEGYATGAVMGVPGHDSRDYAFAKAFGIEILQVIDPLDFSTALPYEGKRGHMINSAFLDGLDCVEAATVLSKQLIAEGIAQNKTFYRLKDWGVSRQRYWGTPIPMVQNSSGQWLMVPESELPVQLPPYQSEQFGKGNPLENNQAWRAVTLADQNCSRVPETFDTFVESAWYYARYTCPHYAQGMLDAHATATWLPIDHYIGGIEHATMHLLYFRFFHKLLHEMGLVSSTEPVKRLTCQGMVIGPAYYRFNAEGLQEWVAIKNVTHRLNPKTGQTDPYDSEGQALVCVGNCKMSKSKKNGVEPTDLINRYGADAVRLFTAFAAPPEADLVWNEQGLAGTYRFLSRVWKLVHDLSDVPLPCSDQSNNLDHKAAALLKKVTHEYEERCCFNTVVAALMEFFNALQQQVQHRHLCQSSARRHLSLLLQLLNPIAPHITRVLWSHLGHQSPIETTHWPEWKTEDTQKQKQTVVIQVNGKKWLALDLPHDGLEESQVIQKALTDPKVSGKVGSGPYKTIYKSGRVLNFVTQTP